jgi:predicted dehydrogenase
MKVGLIGAGLMGTTHADVWSKKDDANLSAVLECDKERGLEIEKKYGCTVFCEADQFFEEGEFDLVDVCVPTSLHEKLVIEALEREKHVFCEKPLTLSVDSALRIQEKVRESGKKFMAAQVIRFWPQYIKIREMVEEGTLGEVRKVHAYRIAEIPQWGTWFRKPELGGGALYDLHIHDLDYIYSLFGVPNDVYARGRKGDFDAWDSLTSTLSWDSMDATIETDWTYPKGFPFQFGIRVRGTEGAFLYSFEVTGNVESKESAQERLLYITSGEIKEIDCSGMPDGYTAEITYFADCAQNEKTVEQATIDEAVEVLRLVEREQKSLAN